VVGFLDTTFVLTTGFLVLEDFTLIVLPLNVFFVAGTTLGFCVAAGMLVGVAPKPVAETGAVDFVLNSTNFCISAQVLF
jgi:hypothetical protein